MFQIQALATDYDGTLATEGKVQESTQKVLRRFKDSGRKLILVTGRELPELEEVFPELPCFFDCVVAENGALLYWPRLREQRILADPPDARFVRALRAARVRPLSVGNVIVATQRPHETTVLRAIREMGLDCSVIFNKESVMVLPSGVNKQFGLRRALLALGISNHHVIGVGDAENDLSFLEHCGISVAVGNALGDIKRCVDLVTASDQGAGVVELMEQILEDELASFHLAKSP